MWRLTSGWKARRLRVTRWLALLYHSTDFVVCRHRQTEIDRGVGAPEPVEVRQPERPCVVRSIHDRGLGHATIVQHQGVAAGRPHPQRVPVRIDAPAGGATRYQRQHAGGRVGGCLRIDQHQHVIGCFQHGREHLPSGDAVSALDRSGAHRQRSFADQGCRSGFGEIAADHLALSYDQIGEVLLCFWRDFGALHQRHHHRGMHVERQSRRRTSLPQRLIGDRVTEEIEAGAAEGFIAQSVQGSPRRAGGHSFLSDAKRHDRVRPILWRNRPPTPNSVAADAPVPR